MDLISIWIDPCGRNHNVRYMSVNTKGPSSGGREKPRDGSDCPESDPHSKKSGSNFENQEILSTGSPPNQIYGKTFEKKEAVLPIKEKKSAQDIEQEQLSQQDKLRVHRAWTELRSSTSGSKVELKSSIAISKVEQKTSKESEGHPKTDLQLRSSSNGSKFEQKPSITVSRIEQSSSKESKTHPKTDPPKKQMSSSESDSQRAIHQEKQSNYRVDFTKVRSVPNPSRERWWYPDPYTGFYVPEDHFGEVSPAPPEKKVKKDPKPKNKVESLGKNGWWVSMEDLPDSLS